MLVLLDCESVRSTILSLGRGFLCSVICTAAVYSDAEEPRRTAAFMREMLMYEQTKKKSEKSNSFNHFKRKGKSFHHLTNLANIDPFVRFTKKHTITYR